MRESPVRRSGPALLLALLLAAGGMPNGCTEHTVAPQNRNPIIISVTVFPSDIGPGDSLIVICEAIDPDAETMVYDWTTDGRLKIKGGYPGVPELYNTRKNSQVFYYNNVTTPPETTRVHCYARDNRGGVAHQVTTVVLH